MKYICLGYYSPEKHAAMTAAELERMVDACFEYDDHLRASGHWAGGEGLQPAATALTVYWGNGKVATTDGPYAETKEQLGGIFLINARNVDEAIEVASKWPSARLGSIEVRPLAPELRPESRYL
jgi:hypothetical protein